MLQQQLENIIQSLPLLAPALWLTGTLFALLIGNLFQRLQHWMPLLAAIGLVFTAHAIYEMPTQAHNPMLGVIEIRNFHFFHLVPVISGILALWLGWWDQKRPWTPFSSALLVMMVLGAHLMLLAAHAIVLYIGIEMLSIGAYLLTAQSLKKTAVEAGLKYAIFGGLSSAIMLYGISLLYGASGFLMLKPMLQHYWASDLGLLGHMGMLMFTAGLLFKLTAVPMHVWAPDIYEAVPSAIAAFFSVVPKAAAVVVLMQWASWIPANAPFWPEVLAFVALASMILGNVSAIWQKSAKRMLAYSSIAHAGFLLVPVVSSTGGMGSHQSPLAFYIGVYVLMNFAAFAGVQMVEEQNGSDALSGFEGRGREFPVWGAAMLIVALSLVGIPITAGFTAKLLIFSGLWESYQQLGNSWQLWLLVLGLSNAVISLFYYLKIPYLMFFREEQSPEPPHISAMLEFTLLVLTGALLLFFFKPDWLWWQ